MNLCVDCGTEYEYDPCNPKGCSSLRCNPCRKKDSKLNKKFRLLELASKGNPSCLVCGYRISFSALTLVDAVVPIKKPETKQEIEHHTSKQFVSCLNCKARLERNEISFDVTSIDPLEVFFYESKVEIVKVPLKEIKGTASMDEADFLDVEVL